MIANRNQFNTHITHGMNDVIGIFKLFQIRIIKPFHDLLLLIPYGCIAIFSFGEMIFFWKICATPIKTQWHTRTHTAKKSCFEKIRNQMLSTRWKFTKLATIYPQMLVFFLQWHQNLNAYVLNSIDTFWRFTTNQFMRFFSFFSLPVQTIFFSVMKIFVCLPRSNTKQMKLFSLRYRNLCGSVFSFLI